MIQLGEAIRKSPFGSEGPAELDVRQCGARLDLDGVAKFRDRIPDGTPVQEV